MSKYPSLFYPAFWIILVVLLTHGVMLLNDGFYWDGWLHAIRQDESDWAAFEHEFFNAGVAGEAYGHRLIGALPFGVSFSYRLTAILSFMIIGWGIYRIALLFLRPDESLWLSLLTLVYPAFEVGFEFAIVYKLLSYALFILGALGMVYWGRGPGWQRILLRVGMLACFWCSFWISSFLVFYAGFIWLWFWGEKPPALKSLWRFCLSRLDFLLLPPLFWLYKEHFFPRGAAFAGYNKILLNGDILNNTRLFLNNAILGQFRGVVEVIWQQPLLVLLIWLALLALAPRLWPAALPSQPPRYLIGTGFLGLLLGISPYILVGRAYLPDSMDTRHAILMNLPMALLMLGVTGQVFGERLAGRVGLALLGILFGLMTLQNYVDWQARWVKDASIMHNLAGLSSDYSTYWIDDRFRMGPAVQHDFYEWSSLFKLVWGGHRHNGVYIGNLILPRDKASTFYIEDYYLDAWNPQGCQAILTIERGPRPVSFRDEWGVSLRYWAFRYVFTSSLDSFLADFTRLSLRGIFSPQASDCPSTLAYQAAFPDSALLAVDELTHMRHLQTLIGWEGEWGQTQALWLEQEQAPEFFGQQDIDWDFYRLYARLVER